MSDSKENPYRSPAAIIEDAPRAMAGESFNPYLLGSWAAVFALNLIVPVFLGLMLTGMEGQAGMCLTVGALFLAGGWFCFAFPRFGRRLIAGAVVIGLSQIFPIAHFVAGSVALAVAEELQLTINGHGPTLTFLGSILVTLLVGGFFMFGGFGLGCLAALFLPAAWFEAKPQAAHGIEQTGGQGEQGQGKIR